MKLKELSKHQKKKIAYAKYLEVQQPAWKAYKKIENPAWRAYLAKCRRINGQKK